jgi:hypothetical protein
MNERDYTRCDICGVILTPDRMHIIIDNGVVIRNTYCCRKHRYVKVVSVLGGDKSDGHNHDWMTIDPDVKALDAFSCSCGAYKYVTIQERTDREIENLAFKYRQGELSPGWE